MDTPPQPTSADLAAVNGEAEGPDLSGRTMGDFRLLRCLGAGGMGQVYLAEQLSLKRKVALKIMRADLAASMTALKRFQAEAEAVARVTHANIVQVFSIGSDANLHYMALEYVEGKTLREFIAKKGPPDLPLALSILRQVAAALVEAHDAGIIHRDIKPENILVTRKGEVKVADFGLSRCFGVDRQPLNITQSGVSMGTPLYMSPEQVQGHDVDPRTDIYSLGVSAYHMLTGQPPFRGQTAFEVAVQHVQNQAVPLSEVRPDLPAEMCQLIQKMMAKAPAERYQSSAELHAELVRLSESLSGVRSQTNIPVAFSQALPVLPPASTLVAAPPLRRRSSSRRLALAAAVVLSLVLAAGAGAGLRLWHGHDAPPLAPATELSLSGEAIALTPAPPGREAALLAAYRKEPNARDWDEIRRHMETAVQLGTLYLEQRRLAEAGRFFKEMQQRPGLYSAWGRIGQAATLAYENQAAESNKLFLAELERARPLFGGDKGGKGWDARQFLGKGAPSELVLLMMPPVRRVIAEALDFNAANLGTAFPPELDRYRKVAVLPPFKFPMAIPNPPGKDKDRPERPGGERPGNGPRN